ncbi:MAG: Gldg family protein [Gammaproteobacteria bacterium]|nr:Gldg family protein [Gammaproteobacteria bacterium]MDH5802966.1 Gldg family protein [Gammaproteobacteria bacterium]
MKNTKLISSTGILIALVLLLAVNILTNVIFKSARIDLTEDNLYTLSKGTKNIIGNFEEPVTLHFYFSEKLASKIPALMNYGNRVRELLEEYASHSGGNVRLIVSDPEPFSDAEDQAVQNGLQGVPIDNAGSTAYFGLVGTNSTDDKEVIPFFQQDKEAALEYDITRLVYKLGNSKKTVVGLLSTLPVEGDAPNPMMMGQPSDEWMVVSQLKQLFDVRTLAKDVDKIPDDVSVLMLVHPKELSDKTQFAIDQFVLRGGRALVFADPHAEAEEIAPDPNNPMAAAMASKASDLKKLFDAWGVELVPGKLATDVVTAARVTINQGMRPQNVEYVVWMQLQKDNISNDDFVTAELDQITLASGGQLQAKSGATTQFTPLMETSDKAMSVDTSRVQFRPDPMGLLNSYQPGGKKLTLAARVTGEVKSAFPNGAPDGAQGEWLKESREAINIIIVADTDMLQDRFWVNVQNFFGQRVAIPRANNGALVINAVENLSGSNDLIGLRSRGNFSRPFEKVKEIQREAEKNFRAREKQLQAKLRDTERKISELQRQKGGDNETILSPEQRREIDKFRNEQVKTRKDLRNVQHELRKNIESLGSFLKFANTAFIPILIILFAIGLGVYRHKRMDRMAG